MGDLLTFGATGGHVQYGAEVVEILGPFVPGVMADNGEILSPMGAPNAVMFIARSSGWATINVYIGNPWDAPQITTIKIVVEF